jgi:hypothetical protein
MSEMIDVYRYGVTIYEWDDTQDEDLIVIGNNEKQREEQVKKTYYSSHSISYSLISRHKFPAEEVMERFNLSESDIEEIVNGENLELEDDVLFSTDYFDDCKLSIEEIRSKRIIDAGDFDVEGIIAEISSKYILTPKRKDILIDSLNKLKL